MTAMTTLHIINRTTLGPALQQLLARCCPGDALIFIQDGCYGLRAPQSSALLEAAGIQCYAIAEDLSARNITSPSVTPLDYQQFVELSLTHHKTISW